LRSGFTIVIAPNEDGFGTSAWAVRLARELAREGRGRVARIKVVVATDKRERFHEDKYTPDLPVDRVRLEGVTKRIELVARSGAVDVKESIEQAILPYADSCAQYEEALSRQRVFENANLVVDLRVPQIVRAAYRENLRRARESKRPMTCVTIFDHAWSLSLRRIASSDTARGSPTQNVEDALADIENDETLTQEAILFREPICPSDYHGYWRRILGRTPRLIPGALGGPLCALEYAKGTDFDVFRSRLEESGQCPEAAYDRAREHAQAILGTHKSLRTLFISGAGTTVWDDVLEKMINDYETQPPQYNIVTYSPAEVKRRGIKMEIQGGVERGTSNKTERLIFVDRTFGDTHLVLFPAFDLVLTRAGGGTVNDAIACRVPLVLVEQPGMWQIEQIREACRREKIARVVTLGEFKKRPRACVESGNGLLKELENERSNMLAIPNHSEIWLVRELLKMAGATRPHEPDQP